MKRSPHDVAALLKALAYPRGEVVAALVIKCGLSRGEAEEMYEAAPD